MGNLFSKSTESLEKRNKRALDSDDSFDSEIKRKRIDSDEDEVLIKITETNVGIIAYVNPNLKGFHSILKYRAEDFLVNEVDMDKNIVHLTSFEPPNTKLEGEEKMEIYPSDVFDQEVTKLLGTDFAQTFRAFLDHPENTDATLTVPADKDTRVLFYRLVNGHLEPKVYCRGKEGHVIIKWPSGEYNEEFIDWSRLGGHYLQASMQKMGVDTMNAINIISKKVGANVKNFGYAGIKDARAITTQTLTMKGVKPGRIMVVQEELNKSGLYLGDFKFVSNGLTLGDLGGNYFTIVLRDVQGATEAELEEALQSLKNNGFLNYFGMQRFGTSSVLTHTIGCAIIKKDYKEASNLILRPREGEREDYHRARTLWEETQDAKATLAILPKRAFSERKLLQFYSNNPNQHAKAIKSLPRNMLSLYLHAYQSYIWNRVVSERVRLFGTSKPMVGDLVLVDNETKNTNNSFINNNAGRRDPTDRKVPKVLTEEDLDKYSIEDVVYPLPGRSTLYPENEIKELYRKFMAEDGISIEKRDNQFEGLKGDYRSMLSKPENMSWSFIRYNDPTEKLCNTDVDKIENKPEPLGVADGKYLALRVEFTLGTSQYATMALREIMRTETSSQVQSTLSHN
ncbi:pseudouridine synthase [Cokeromyces recurvatus]|uniref:pseudouridine synthase n=1 Tax=Cokeromyces recurvatus TaxID=90255 RepID=UPI00221EF75B|nr:pseudouridine synthase [Cokeromyces recurvatus]KAI7907261.1 pseudouridine synthase [Cokeromyces recurvatus]